MVIALGLTGIQTGDDRVRVPWSEVPPTALHRCLGVGTPDALERRVSGCRADAAAPEQVDRGLAACLGAGTPDALERRVPSCRAAVGRRG
jgi:hypothetical protein